MIEITNVQRERNSLVSAVEMRAVELNLIHTIPSQWSSVCRGQRQYSQAEQFNQKQKEANLNQSSQRRV